MHHDIYCPLHIYFGEHELDANQLISISQTIQPKFELTLQNDFGESRDFIFQSNRELSKTSSKIDMLCHFEGISNTGEHSAMSTCSMSLLGGLFTINGRRFVLEVGLNALFHFVPLSDHSCDWGLRSKRSIAGSHVAEYYAQFLDGRWRYVELALIADKLVFEKYHKNVTEVMQRLNAITNYINSLYLPINIRVVLVWADVWTNDNPVDITSNSDTTLWNFLNWRKGLLKDHPHDNAHLLTGVIFENNVVGKAFKGTMCSYDFSGGVDIEHSDQAAYVAATIAHEMGHNFGMEHDIDEIECRCPAKSCIMSPATGITHPTFWSECSMRALQHSFSRGVDYCLRNSPTSVFGGARCGNGIVEAGEECDCGTPSSCINKCCNPATCRLSETAVCATGECCDLNTCQLLSATTVCRQATNECDLPEYCDGLMEHCPADFFVQDGHECPNHVDDYCYNGYCGSRDAQCQHIWGSTGRNAAPACYDLNLSGSSGGNCGFLHETNRFVPCNKNDIKCGRLHCIHENEKLVFGDPSTVYTAYTGLRLRNGEDVACRVIWTKYISGQKEPDPGMVPNGAVCGQDEMCVDAKCQNRTAKVLMAPKCEPVSCNNAGICNNMGNCHCDPGYGGSSCAIPGGVIHVGIVVFWLLLVLTVAFIGISIIVKRKRDFWLHKKIWKKLKTALKIEKLLVPIRKAPPPPRSNVIRTADLNSVWGDTASNVLRMRSYHQPLPPNISPPVVPSTLNLLSTKPAVIAHRNSIRPATAPPKVPKRPRSEALQALYAEKGSELTINLTEQISPMYCIPPATDIIKMARTESFRPIQAPPPPPLPPHYNETTNKTISSKNDKPMLAAKSLNVMDIAARFDPKTSQTSIVRHWKISYGSVLLFSGMDRHLS
ncbi:Disintegrin and metalloproteinase domain-containing protein 12 [Dirofilaria immitis]|nr:Disintegrin and metalloproteinase domain-containing protein 12 [Dirofilaria immitis]